MASDFIPEKDGQAAAWMKTFAAGIAADPAAWHIAPADSAALSSAVQAYLDALAVATSPDTRTKSAVRGKTDARWAAEQACRRVARRVQGDDTLSETARLNIGLPQRKRTRTPRRVPRTAPAVHITGATYAAHQLLVVDPARSPRTGKPFGAVAVQVFMSISTGPQDNAGAARYCGSFTSARIRIAHSPDDAGKTATYFARWVGRRGDVGPWSTAIGMSIAA